MSMCRKNQLLAVALAGAGIGLLLACFFESGFIQCFFGIGLIIAGVTLLQKK